MIWLLQKGHPLEDILKRDGLSFELLKALSYSSTLGIRLKKNLHYFDKQKLFDELKRINEWYDTCNLLQGIAIDYRIKSIQSAMKNIKTSLRRLFGMCYLIAKKFNDVGCLALQAEHGPHLANFKKKLAKTIGYDTIQLVTISRPSAYGEYEPYHFFETEQEFEEAVKNM